MKKIICTIIIIALMLICDGAVISVSAETRSIYIGDIITLEISSQKLSEEELRQKFKDFEIIELQKESDRYLLSIRTFEHGEYTIIAGDKELVISVGSTLTDIQRADIFEAEPEILELGFSFNWKLLFYGAAGAFAISGCFILIKIIRGRKAKPESPYELFWRRSSELSYRNDNYFVDLTLFFKEYIECVNKCRIIGKTSAEIVNELISADIAEEVLPEIRKWLTECDIYKFAGIGVSDDEKHHHYTQLLSIVKRIEEKNTDVNEGAA